MRKMVSEKEYNELLKAWNELHNENQGLNQENLTLYEELKQTRRLVETRTEEMQEEFFTILGNIKLLHKKGKTAELIQYIDEQYYILKKELFDDYQSNK